MQPTSTSFHLRIPPHLKEKLESSVAESGKSLNREILDRLAITFEPDAAVVLANSLRPILNKLDEADRNKVVEMVVETFSILAKKPARQRRLKS